MSDSSLEPIDRLVKALRRLPGVGEKTATRLAYFMLSAPESYAAELGQAILRLRADIRLCEECFNLTSRSPCEICRDDTRDASLVCVVEEPYNLQTIERTRDFRGRYHVLHGALSPLQGIGPDELRVRGLLDRVRAGEVEEVILATSPTVEGEATAVYLARILKPLGVKVTRIAMGIPVGSDLDWADEVTMAKALEGRREY